MQCRQQCWLSWKYMYVYHTSAFVYVAWSITCSLCHSRAYCNEATKLVHNYAGSCAESASQGDLFVCVIHTIVGQHFN